MRRTLLAWFLLALVPLGWGADAPAPAGASAAAGAPARSPSPPPTQFPPADDEPYWTVGVATFSGKGLSPENRYLVHSLPLGLRERLVSIGRHFFVEGERRGYQEAVIRRASRRQGQQLEALRRERDELFFQEQDEQALAQKQKALDGRIRQAVEALTLLQSLDPAGIRFPEKKEIRFATGGREEVLLPAPAHSALREARSAAVNLLVWGGLEEVQGYLYLEVRAVDAALQQEVFSFRDAATREELPAVLEPALAALERLLWGRDWASVAVQASPPEARIFLDGALLGTGQARLDFVGPGDKELRVELEGYESSTRQVTVQPYSLAEFDVVLEKRSGELIAISSDPPGAALYRGSTWLGITPVEVDRPDSLSRFLLRSEGFLDQPLYLGPQTRPAFSSPLLPADLDPALRQKQDRNRFYTAFGLFALSLPLPIFIWGYVNDFAAGSVLAGVDGNTVDAQRLFDTGYGLYYTFWGAVGLSTGLAVNMLIQLLRYVRAADRKA